MLKLPCQINFSESEISKIKLSIDKNLGKKSDLDVSIDDSIIGGIKLRINNTYLDGSVQNKLQVLKHTLLPNKSIINYENKYRSNHTIIKRKDQIIR